MIKITLVRIAVISGLFLAGTVIGKPSSGSCGVAKNGKKQKSSTTVVFKAGNREGETVEIPVSNETIVEEAVELLAQELNAPQNKDVKIGHKGQIWSKHEKVRAKMKETKTQMPTAIITDKVNLDEVPMTDEEGNEVDLKTVVRMKANK